MNNVIIGLTGQNSSGKEQVALYFNGIGFKCYSLSDVIRSEAQKRKLPCTRSVLIDLGRELRLEHGNGYLAEQIIRRIETNKNYVIDSFRHPDEVAVFRKINNFNLIAIESKQNIRFERMKLRNRTGDPQTFEEFLKLDLEESVSTKTEGQNLTATIATADYVIENNDTIEELYLKLNDL